MPSTYTTNLGIEKPGNGEQDGAWGTTINTNYDMFDQAINGIATISLPATGSTGAPNALPITNGTVSSGRNRYIEFTDGADLGGTAYVQLTPNDAQKIVHVRNSLSGSRAVVLFQGTYNAGRAFTVPNGKDAMLRFAGEGATSPVTQVFADLLVDAVDVATFSLAGSPITATGAELNLLDGVTTTTAELNLLDGVTATTAELNLLDGVTATTAELNLLDGVTSTTAELNILDGVTATAAELNLLDGVTATTAELNYTDGVTSAIQTQLNGKQATITGGATTIASSNLTVSRALVSDVSGKVGVSAVTSTELGYLDGVTSAIQTQLDSKLTAVTGAATTIVSDDLTADRALISNALGKVVVSPVTNAELAVLDGVTATTAELNLLDGVTATTAELNLLDGVTATTAELNLLDGVTATTAELNYTDGVTSAIQTQLNSKQATITGGATTIAAANLTIDRALISDASGKVVVSPVTSTELSYLDGVTSNIQTQLDATGTAITGGATTIVSADLTASRALVSDASGKVAVSPVTSTELGYLDGVTSNIQTQLDATAITITGAATTIVSDDLTIDRVVISNASGKIAVSPVTSTELAVLDGVTATTAELNILDGVTATTAELNYTDGVTSAIQTQLNSKQATITGAASSITVANFTEERAIVSDASGKVAASPVTSAELSYLDGVTSSVQAQLDGKQATITGGATTITGANLTVSRALVSDISGKVGVSAVTSTELGYLDGVTSAIQTQLNGKQPTVTGGATSIAADNLTASRALVSDASGKVAISAVTSTELGYLDGVTSAIQTQLNGKASTATTITAGNGLSGGGSLAANRTLTVGAGNGISVAATSVAMSGSYTGTFTATGDVRAGSDRKLKSDFEPIENAAALLDGFRSYRYWRKDLEEWQYGVVAQDVAVTMPEAVSLNVDADVLTVSHNQILAVLLERVRELEARLDAIAG